MRLSNDGKFNLFEINIFKYKIELDLFLTRDCSNSIRDFALLELKIWRRNYKGQVIKLIKSFKNEKIRLRLKP